MVSKVDLTPVGGHSDSTTRRVGFGILRATLLFGTACVMLALVLAPIAEKKTRQFAQNRPMARDIDSIATGSVRPVLRRDAYIVRRSVLSPETEFICLSATGGPASAC